MLWFDPMLGENLGAGRRHDTRGKGQGILFTNGEGGGSNKRENNSKCTLIPVLALPAAGAGRPAAALHGTRKHKKKHLLETCLEKHRHDSSSTS